MRMILILALMCSSAIAQEAQVSVERQAAMLPWVAHDREQAMNDRALCSADLVALKQQLDAANKQIAELKATSKPAPTPD